MEASRLWISSSSIALWALASFTIYLLSIVSKVKRYENEPPYIEPKVPIIGHVIGLLQLRYSYFVNHFKKSRLQIFSLAFPGMPGGRVYIINSPELAVSVQRRPTKVSFWRVEAVFTGKLVGLSPSAAKTLADNVDGDDSQRSYLREGMVNVHTTMKPGESLTNITRAAVEMLAVSIKDLAQKRSPQIELRRWITEELMASVTSSIFGFQNPYRDPEVAEGFWVFQENAAGLMSFPFPSITCAKSYAARERIVAAFEKYYADRGCDTASPWVQGATTVSENFGISDKNKARIDVSNSHAILANTIPAAFWTIYHIFSDATTVDGIRSAMTPFLTTRENNGNVTYDIDISQIRNVPILRSVLSEALRHYANGTGTRIVVEDTMLDGHYLLKKDCFVFMPNRSYHFDTSAWGSTIDDFDARRFVKSRAPNGSFRAFGGGVNLCPGRFFAMDVILAMSAILALRFDIRAATGTWVHPGVDDSNMTQLVHPPKDKVLVEVTPREGWVDGEWTFSIS